MYSSSYLLLPGIIAIILSFNKNMGSAPSYEGQEDNIALSARKSRHTRENRNETMRTSKNRQKQGENQDENPEQKVEGCPIQVQVKEKSKQDRNMPLDEENLSQENPHPAKSKLASYEQIAKENLPKRAPVEDDEPEQENEEENAIANRDMVERRVRHHIPIRGKGQHTSRHQISEQQQPQVVQERHKVRHYVKDNTRNQHNIEQDIPHNPHSIKKTQRKSEEIDYHQYDSAHIRHKAAQEVHQMQHPIHPIKQKEPIYEHEKLYPKLLKNYHADSHEHRADEHRNNSNNRHIEHERNAQEQYYEQPHNINIYKRHRIPTHGHPHRQEQLEQQPEPKSNPFKGAQKHEVNNLQKSMEVRGSEHQQVNEIRKSMNIRVKGNIQDGQTIKKRKESENVQEENEQVPRNANFKRRKPSLPPAEGKRDLEQAKNKLKQLQSKSIAEVNKENEFNVTEYDADPQDLVTCREGCGRKFNSDRIDKHEVICRKVFQEKRKQFNAQDQRIVSKEQKKLLKKNVNTKPEEPKKRGKVSKWKAQSIALRAHIKMGMDENYVPNEQQKEMLSQEHHIDIVNCPYCARNFNKNSAKTHIPFCKAQYEKQMEKERFEKPPRGGRK